MNKNYWQRENIKLRTLEEKDLQMYINERNTPDSIRQWYEDKLLPPYSTESTRKEFEKTLLEFNREDKKIFVLETLDEQYVGEISIWLVNQMQRYFRYGIFVNEEFRGKGYAKNALIVVLDYYFNELNYHKASPTVYSYNVNSQKFHENFGFKLEGQLREEVYTRGKYYDMYSYGMLKGEFNNKYSHFA